MPRRRHRDHAAQRRRAAHPAGRAAQQGPGWPDGFLDADGLMGVNFGGFLVRTPEHVVVVDTGIGGGAIPELPIGSFPDELAAAGVAPDDVDVVVFTHLHFDHVGWSTDGEPPLFTRASTTPRDRLGPLVRRRPARGDRAGPRGLRRDPGAAAARAARRSIALHAGERRDRPGRHAAPGAGPHARGTASSRSARAASALCCSPTPPTTRRSCSATTGPRRPTSIPSSPAATRAALAAELRRHRHAGHDDPRRAATLRPARDDAGVRRWRYAPSIE